MFTTNRIGAMVLSTLWVALVAFPLSAQTQVDSSDVTAPPKQQQIDQLTSQPATDPATSQPAKKSAYQSADANTGADLSAVSSKTTPAADPKTPDPLIASSIEKEKRTGLFSSDRDTTNNNQTKSLDDSWVIRTLGALAIVIALIYLLRVVLKRMVGPVELGSGAGGMVQVLTRTTIGPKVQVIFLRVNERIVVVAHTASGMQTLTEFDDPDQVAQMIQNASSTNTQSISFSFKKLMNKLDKNYADPIDIHEEGADDSEHQVDRAREEVSGLLGRLRKMNKNK